ncbi:MAG: hypothetical protein DCF25_02455 [Leptolyngbya foveolarum]|uniref:CobQ/CobB/MinD/ParA nucleotide binding domain-containing protein n=1 Tax=Leptolyngbya foveolarum TaxID=47253 RepID=A0A2W4WJU2_9CYAN|nr:MAG: hypothetical protein DCF25_02455 [Leptolyngbya foveolarum]
MTRLHIVTGDKGNVGKSAWCTAMIECYRHHGTPLALVDADSDSQTLSKVYDSAFPIEFSDDLEYAPFTDSIYEIALKEVGKKKKGGDVLVDLPAGGEKFINKWINDCDLTERAKADEITIIKWWVSDSDSSSIQMFEKDVARYPSIKYVFLKNMGRSSPPQWTSFDESETIEALVKKKRISVYEVPGIPSAILDKLRVAGAQLIDVINDEEYKKYGLSTVMRVRSWVTSTRRLIDSAMPEEKKKATRKKAVAQESGAATAADSTMVAELLEAPTTVEASPSDQQTKVPATVESR